MKNIKSLSKAKIAVERLTDYSLDENMTKVTPYKPRFLGSNNSNGYSSKVNMAKTTPFKSRFWGSDNSQGKRIIGGTRWRNHTHRAYTPQEHSQRGSPPRGNHSTVSPTYALCKGPHSAQGCPKRQALSALITETVVETMFNVSAKKDKGKEKAIASSSHSKGSSSDHSSEDKTPPELADFVIGGILMQKGHSTTYESRKLNDTE
ncbi:Retrovirus-related Pol polyprotein from transposon 17.6 [Canna indica]|uniref:Retrovirus-related Pol polyprotein from transposon 17.6 n=1 Tax=Canna indica TaxID=4628 RepID=A0AAQ3QQJ6_9LILI|nr:Retrovirus-related Pol polyprotein from transposon 17.6 [Canna indica]